MINAVHVLALYFYIFNLFLFFFVCVYVCVCVFPPPSQKSSICFVFFFFNEKNILHVAIREENLHLCILHHVTERSGHNAAHQRTMRNSIEHACAQTNLWAFVFFGCELKLMIQYLKRFVT